MISQSRCMRSNTKFHTHRSVLLPGHGFRVNFCGWLFPLSNRHFRLFADLVKIRGGIRDFSLRRTGWMGNPVAGIARTWLTTCHTPVIPYELWDIVLLSSRPNICGINLISVSTRARSWYDSDPELKISVILVTSLHGSWESENYNLRQLDWEY